MIGRLWGQVPGYERVHVCRRTNYTISLFTTLRDRTTGTAAYVQASSKLAELLLNEALALLPFAPTSVVTPVDEATYLGMTMPDPETELCVVSILRAADSIAEVAMRMLPGVAVGKMLIQRDEETARAKLTYTKFPTDIAARKVGPCTRAARHSSHRESARDRHRGGRFFSSTPCSRRVEAWCRLWAHCARRVSPNRQSSSPVSSLHLRVSNRFPLPPATHTT